MKDVSSAAVDKLSVACEKSCNGYRPEWDAFCPQCDEEAFNRILELERKRSERSKRPFLLMLLSLEGVASDDNGGNLGAKVFSCLAATKRDIDVMGWYRQDSVAGIIFTEISGANDWPLYASIGRRIEANLALRLGPEEIKGSRISFHSFPGNSGRQISPDCLTLYPDITNRLNSHTKGLFVKRIIDIFGAFIALGVLSPFFLMIAAMIKLSTEGPVFFRQQRVGQYGRKFTFLKFRSMYVNSDPSLHMEYTKNLIRAENNGPGNGASQESALFKIRNDPRITPVGRFLRRSSLDEIPQLLNVLAGDMSLVGPRPPIPYELENYDLWHLRRVLEMRPGMTGIWQVAGRSRTTFDEMVRLDIFYMTHWSLWLDIKLILKTPLAILSRKGAY